MASASSMRPVIANILLHMGHDPYHMSRLEVALALTRRFRAHLEIAYILSPAGMPAAIQGRAASSAFMAEATAIAREHVGQVHDQIVRRCAEVGIDWTWEVLEGKHNKPLADRSMFADLLVVNRHHGINHDHVSFESVSDLVIHACCPVLMIPRSYDPAREFGRRILIAWKDCREASHAIRRARGFLREADHIVLLTIGPDGRDGDRDVVGYLQRHDIAVEPLHIDGNASPANAILTAAADQSCDMIVMGAYGRSRWLEMLTHGVTHQILHTAQIPVLASH